MSNIDINKCHCSTSGIGKFYRCSFCRELIEIEWNKVK